MQSNSQQTLQVSIDALKQAAGFRAADCITDGMVVGLGSGSTARHATLRVAARLSEGSLADIVAIPTSDETERLARERGIPLTTLDDHPRIDITIDGADEVDPELDIIKGLGGFLVREKIVAYATEHEIIVVDHSKRVNLLGTRSPVPVEVVRFGWRNTMAALERTGAHIQMRMAGNAPYITDEGNYILDCRYPDGIEAPADLNATLNTIPGVVDNGLFLGVAKTVIIASPDGIEIVKRRP